MPSSAVHPRSQHALASREFHRILIVKPSSLGDVVHALPVLHGLRRRYPDARIDWLVGRAFAPLIDGHPDLNELILFDRSRYGQLAREPLAARDFARFLANLRRRRYDLVIDLQGLFRSGLLTWSTRAPVRIGFRDAREGAWLFYNHRLPREPADTHAVDRNYGVARLLGFAEVPVRFSLPMRPEDDAAVTAILAGAGVAAAAPFVAVMPGARWETKVWPADRFAQTIDELERMGHRCVLLGGPDDAPPA